jgi:acetate---CoA ligase (ADP-forming)
MTIAATTGSRVEPEHIIADARRSGRGALDEVAGKRLLERFAIPVPRGVLARDADDAAQKVRELRPPLAAKVVSPDLLHKSDAGGVRLNLDGPAAVRRAIDEMTRLPAIAGARVEGWLIEEMAPQGQEVVVGGYADPRFGPMVMVGLGGVTAELFRDVIYRPAPVSGLEAEAMLGELKAAPLLRGFRGAAKADVAALSKLIAEISVLAARLRESVSEIELNPVLVHPEGKGVTVVDALVVKRKL